MAGSGFEKHREVHHPADRCGGDLASEVNKVADEPPWSTQRKITSFWLVHPCTPRRRIGIGDDPECKPGLASPPNRLGPWEVSHHQTKRVEAYKKTPIEGRRSWADWHEIYWT
jgi:hypothetical protein